jgi:hypothetical protein
LQIYIQKAEKLQTTTKDHILVRDNNMRHEVLYGSKTAGKPCGTPGFLVTMAVWEA